MTLIDIANHAIIIGSVIHLALKLYLAWNEIRRKAHAD